MNTDTGMNQGEGWYEWITPGTALTNIAYVYEGGSIYFPEGDADVSDFLLSAARGDAHRLVRADSLEQGEGS